MAMQSTTGLRPEGKKKRIRKLPCSQSSSCWNGWGAWITRTSCRTQLPLRSFLRSHITGLSAAEFVALLPSLPPSTVYTHSCMQTHSLFPLFFFILFFLSCSLWHCFITPWRNKFTLKLFIVFTELFMTFGSRRVMGQSTYSWYKHWNINVYTKEPFPADEGLQQSEGTSESGINCLVYSVTEVLLSRFMCLLSVLSHWRDNITWFLIRIRLGYCEGDSK